MVKTKIIETFIICVIAFAFHKLTPYVNLILSPKKTTDHNPHISSDYKTKESTNFIINQQ